MQEAKVYFSLTEAESCINTQLAFGWKVYSCVGAGHTVLVVYEKDG